MTSDYWRNARVPPAAREERNKKPFCGSWGHLVRKPQFEGMEGFRNAIDLLDEVDQRPVAIYGADGQPEPAKGFKAIVSRRSGKVYSVPTVKYQPVQDADVVAPLIEACGVLGLEPYGRVDNAGTGRTSMHVLLASSDFAFMDQEVGGSPIALGFRVWNSFNTETSFGAEAFGIRMACTNYMLVGDILGRFSLRHSKLKKGLIERYAGLFKDMMGRLPMMSEIINRARKTVVVEEQLEDLLWAIKMPKKGIESLMENLEGWCPEVEEEGVNSWTVYNASIAYITHRINGWEHLRATEAKTRAALDLLTEAHDELLAVGKKRRMEYDAMLKNLKEEREALKAAPRIVA